MNNDNKASQPKVESIADDIAFCTLLSEYVRSYSNGWMGDDDVEADKKALFAYLDSKLRAPADQAASVAMSEFTYKDADGMFLDSQDWRLDNERVGSFASAPIYRNGKVVALVFSDDHNFEEEIAENCQLLTGAAQSADKPAVSEREKALEKALRIAVQQNESEMLMTGEECRQCWRALAVSASAADGSEATS